MFNKHNEDLNGWSKEQILGQNFMGAFIPHEERLSLEDTYKGLFHGKPAEKIETNLSTKTGETLSIEWSNTMLLEMKSRRAMARHRLGVSNVTDHLRLSVGLAQK